MPDEQAFDTEAVYEALATGIDGCMSAQSSIDPADREAVFLAQVAMIALRELNDTAKAMSAIARARAACAPPIE